MALKKGGIAYKCWQAFNIEEAEMKDGICPVCDSERQHDDPEEPVGMNVGLHIAIKHQDFLKENNITNDNAVVFMYCQKCDGRFQGKVYVVDGLGSCCRKCYKERAETGVKPPAAPVENKKLAVAESADTVLASRLLVLKSAIGCNDSFFIGKKILNVDVGIIPTAEGDLVHVHVSYINPHAKKE